MFLCSQTKAIDNQLIISLHIPAINANIDTICSMIEIRKEKSEQEAFFLENCLQVSTWVAFSKTRLKLEYLELLFSKHNWS